MVGELLAIGFVAALNTAPYLALLWAVDPARRHKGGWRSLASAAVAGAVATFLPYGLVHALLEEGTRAATSPFLANVLLTGQMEEAAKLVAFLVTARRAGAVREPLDAAIHAAAVGVGFAVMENIFYGVELGLAVQVRRLFLTTPGHMVYTMIVAVYWTLSRRWKGHLWRSPLHVFFVLVPSATLHGLYNHLVESGRIGVAVALETATLAFGVYLLVRLRQASPYRAVRGASAPDARELRGALAAHPSSTLLRRRLAEAHLRRGRWASAVAELDRCLAEGERDPEIRALRGAARLAAGDTERGSRELSDAALAAGYAGRRRIEGLVLAAMGMRTPALTRRSDLVTRYLIVSTLRLPVPSGR